MTTESWIMVCALALSAVGGVVRFAFRILANQAAQQQALEHIVQSLELLREDVTREREARDKQVAELHRRVNAIGANGAQI